MARPVENDKRVSAYIPSDTFESLKRLAQGRGMTVSGFIRMMIIDVADSDLKTAQQSNGDPMPAKSLSHDDEIDALFKSLPASHVQARDGR
jgi:hypothetical protein